MSDRRGSTRSSRNNLQSMLENMANHQRTLALIKPDSYGGGKKDEIVTKLKEAGFKIAFEKEMVLSEEKAKQFYAEHAERPFYSDLVGWMTR